MIRRSANRLAFVFCGATVVLLAACGGGGDAGSADTGTMDVAGDGTTADIGVDSSDVDPADVDAGTDVVPDAEEDATDADDDAEDSDTPDATMADADAADADAPDLGDMDTSVDADASSDAATDVGEAWPGLPRLDGACDGLDCGDGHCDGFTGTCACPAGAWFDGAGCSDVCADGACAEDCSIPTGPRLTFVAASERLAFAARDGEIVEVAVTTDLTLVEPTMWTESSEVELADYEGQAIRVFARVRPDDCSSAGWFSAVYRVHATYPPPAGEPDSPALARDAPSIAGWATEVVDAQRGIDVDDGWWMPDHVLGPAEGTSFDICSLGRGGWIAVGFESAIADGDGPDFAVFENAFRADFVEFAFVEVSTDGETWVRFDSASQVEETVSQYGTVDVGQVGALAGRYMAGFGSTFDLANLRQHDAVRFGDLDLGDVRYVRIVDVVGDGSVTDSFGRPIYDPYPTIESAGFDLDAIAVLQEAP